MLSITGLPDGGSITNHPKYQIITFNLTFLYQLSRFHYNKQTYSEL